MSNSLVNSPNSSFETEDTIKMNSSIISSLASNSHVNLNAVGNGLMNHSNFSLMDQFYQVDNSSFNPLPPPPPISISQSTSSSFSSASSTSAFNNNPQYITASLAPSSTESGVHFHPADGSFLPQPDVTEQQVELQDVTEVHLAPPNNEFFLGNDYSLPNSSYHSVFSNGQAMNSVNSLHDTQSHPQMFKLDSTTDLLNDYSISNMQSSDLMYNLTEFELGNPSLDSIPDAMHNIHIHQNMSLQHLPLLLKDSSSNYSNAVAPSHNAGYPYTPNVTDVYTPPLSDSSSFTPNSTTSTNMQIANISNLAQFNDDVIRPPPSILLKNLTFSNSTPNLHSRKVTKKPSMNRINNNTVMSNKKNLVISTQIANSANPNHSMASSSSHGNTPLSESSPQLLGISPLCNKYKGLEIYQASPTASRSISNASNISAFTTSSVNDSPQIPNKNLMPPLNIFRHNSDSGSSFSSYYETPKRKTSSSLADVSAQKSKKQVAQQIHLQQQQQQQQMQQHLQLQLQQHQHVRHLNEDHNSLSNDSVSNVDGTIGMLKPKKYTRRRLLPRSKNGCWICRIKHLKCDENRPECSSCVKFGIECDYSLNKPDYVLDKNMRKVKLGDISILRKQKQATSKSHKSKVKIEHTDHDKQKLLQQIAHESQLQLHQQHMHSGMIQSHETNNYSSVSAE